MKNNYLIALASMLFYTSAIAQPIENAANYALENNGLAFLAWENGRIIYEKYKSTAPSKIASGTKSFSCAIIAKAQEEGILTPDEYVSQTITEWQNDPQKAKITISQLLHLNSGLEAGKIGRKISTTEALNMPVHKQVFDYGPAPFQVFNEVMKRKLNKIGYQGDAKDYLYQKIFQPIGLNVYKWENESDGAPNMAAGAELTAREWLKYGILIAQKGQYGGKQVIEGKYLQQCFTPSVENPAYGLSFWLNADGITPSAGVGNRGLGTFTKINSLPDDAIMAIGAGAQVMYIIPSRKQVVIRQSKISLRSLFSSYSHQELWDRMP